MFDLIGGETQARSFAVLNKGGALISTLQAPYQQKLPSAASQRQLLMPAQRRQLSRSDG